MITKANVEYKHKRIVRVVETLVGNRVSYGTGFFISSYGQVLTCGHVILGKDFKILKNDSDFINISESDYNKKISKYIQSVVVDIKIQIDNGSYLKAVLERIIPEYDIAVLRILKNKTSYSYFDLELSDEPYIGEDISFYGYPEVLGHTYKNSPFVANRSIVSTYLNVEIGGALYKHMQINATNIGGVSGAPIFRGDNNKVVGIINGNFNWYFNNIVSRDGSGDSIWSTRVPLGIGYATSLKTLKDNTSLFP